MILCGYTGGYTELGGGEKFLQKIRNDVMYGNIEFKGIDRLKPFTETYTEKIRTDCFDYGI